MLELEVDHRRHAEIENIIRDLKCGVGLNHLSSGRFGANAAWLAINVTAHNLARFSTRLGLGRIEFAFQSAFEIRSLCAQTSGLSRRRRLDRRGVRPAGAEPGR
jgi:hypothetical protein